MKLKVIIDGKLHRVVHIEYQNGLPFSVTTEKIYNEKNYKHTVLYHWDFFPNNGDTSDMRYYNSGSGGYSDKKLAASQWIDGYIGVYWLASDFSFDGEVKNGKRLKHPVRLNKWGGGHSINPFNAACETIGRYYCEECGNEGDEYCREHIYEDEQDQYQLKYKSDNRSYE